MLTATLHPEQGSSILGWWPPTKGKRRAPVHGRRHAAGRLFLYQEAFHQTAPPKPNGLPPRPPLAHSTNYDITTEPAKPVFTSCSKCYTDTLTTELSADATGRVTEHGGLGRPVIALQCWRLKILQRDCVRQRRNLLDRCSAATSQHRSACGALLKSLRPTLTRRPRRGERHTRHFNCVSMALPRQRRSGMRPVQVQRCRRSLARPCHSPGRSTQGCCRGRYRACSNLMTTATCPKWLPAPRTERTPVQAYPA